MPKREKRFLITPKISLDFTRKENTVRETDGTKLLFNKGRKVRFRCFYYLHK